MSAGRNDVRRLITAFAAAMKAHGFAKHGSNLRRENIESRDLITFSADFDKASGAVDLVVDYAVFLKAFDSFYRDELDLMKCTPLNGEFIGRLGVRQGDKHWALTNADNVDSLVATLVDLAKKEMLPFFEQHNTIKKSLALLMPCLNDKSLNGRVAVHIMIMARLCNEPAAFIEAQLRAREKLGEENPYFLQKAQRFVAEVIA
jgi:hypothetical protein